MEKTVDIFGIKIHNITMAEAVETIIGFAKGTKQYVVVTPNVDHVVRLQKDTAFQKVYKEADLVLADGKPIIWASRLLKKPLCAKVSGSDLFEQIMPSAEKAKVKLFFFRGAPGDAEKAKQVLLEKHRNLQIVGTYSPPFGFEKSLKEIEKTNEMINKAKPDIVFVGLGSPKQENWIAQNKEKIKTARVFLGVGISFAFVAGSVPRAPKFMQAHGLEWLYRLMKEPSRLWKRYLIEDLPFVKIVLKELCKK